MLASLTHCCDENEDVIDAQLHHGLDSGSQTGDHSEHHDTHEYPIGHHDVGTMVIGGYESVRWKGAPIV